MDMQSEDENGIQYLKIQKTDNGRKNIRRKEREKELKGKDEEGRGEEGCCDEGSLGSVLCHVGYWITTEMRGALVL
jgi:hypothetical protein